MGKCGVSLHLYSVVAVVFGVRYDVVIIIFRLELQAIVIMGYSMLATGIGN